MSCSCCDLENSEFDDDVRRITALAQSIEIRTPLDRRFVDLLLRAAEEIRNDKKHGFFKIADGMAKDSLDHLARGLAPERAK